MTTERFPVCCYKRRPRCWMDVQYKLCLDGAGDYLTVLTSFFGIYADDSDESCLCHFDYERDKSDGYPESHLQVVGESQALANWSGKPRTRQLSRLHFPSGDRRYRPTLEDVIEFMIVEKLADPLPSAKAVLDQERQVFRRHQLRAAIRRDPETAREALREFGSKRQS